MPSATADEPVELDARGPAYVFADCPVTAPDADVAQIRSFTIADAHSRFMRARGRPVLLSVALDAFGAPVELAARQAGVGPHEWVQRRSAQLHRRFQTLGYSIDWERAIVSCDPEQYRWTQWLFLTLLERDLIYRRDRGWFMRVGKYINEAERGLDALAGWGAAAIDSQRAVIDRIDGVEIVAGTFGGESLTVFTPHADEIAQTAFVAISPSHPQIDSWTSDPSVAKQVAAMRGVASQANIPNPEQALLAVTGTLATVPGVAGIVPIVVSPFVDARFGPTAVLGIPERDAIDRAIAKRLPAPARAAWKGSGSASRARPAVRYRAHDIQLSRPRAWGAPIPLVRCGACGVVPVPLDELPVRLPDDLQPGAEDGNPLAERADFRDCTCPSCGGQASRETDTIDPHLDTMWTWLAVCVPPERRGAPPSGEDPEYARWLPAEQVVAQVDAAGRIFEQRLLAASLQDLGQLPPLPGREPFSKALLHQPVRLADASDDERAGQASDGPIKPDELIARLGADTVRLSVLYAASPAHTFNWEHQPWRHCQRFLESLREYAEPRLQAWARHQAQGQAAEEPSIDASEALRKRLAHWCAVACEKITPQFERLELQRATHNAMLLLTRIQDFESRAQEQRRGELDAPDREAIVAALLVLIRLLAPLTPHIAEELWLAAGNTPPVGDGGWPTLSRPRRAGGRTPSGAGLPQ